jgi:hypothetical protein
MRDSGCSLLITFYSYTSWLWDRMIGLCAIQVHKQVLRQSNCEDCSDWAFERGRCEWIFSSQNSPFFRSNLLSLLCSDTDSHMAWQNGPLIVQCVKFCNRWLATRLIVYHSAWPHRLGVGSLILQLPMMANKKTNLSWFQPFRCTQYAESRRGDQPTLIQFI